MTRNHSLSIQGVDMGSNLTEDEYKAIQKTHQQLTSVRNVGYKTGAVIIKELGLAEDILDAGKSGLMDVDGVGRLTAKAIMENLQESRGGWEREIPMVVEYTPDDDKPYRVSIGNVYSQKGTSLKRALIEAAESMSKQKLVDELKRRSEEQ